MMARGEPPLCVGLAGAAGLCGVSYDTLQRRWRAMVDEEGFPSPYWGVRRGERPHWLRAGIVAWMEARSLGEAVRPDAPPAQVERPNRPANDAAAQQNSRRPDRVSALLLAAAGRSPS